MSLAEVIALTFAYYNRGQTLQDAVLAMYVEDLGDLNPQLCIEAYKAYRRNPKNRNFPLPAQIRELVNPEEFVETESQAREIAARIVGAVTKYGWNNARMAKDFIGPIGWLAVERQGGWSYICENLGRTLNPLTFQAQLRDQIEGMCRYGVDVLDDVVRKLPERRSGGLTQIGDITRLLPGGPDEEPA